MKLFYRILQLLFLL